MSKKYKASRYNHMYKLQNGKRLAFNCMSCGLGEMDEDCHKRFMNILENENGDLSEEEKSLEKELVKGGMIVPADSDELDQIRTVHYRMRFGNNSLALTILPTFNCNFACDYCYESRELHSSLDTRVKSMSNEVCDNLVKYVESNLRHESTLSINWYGGEPLMGKAVIEKLTGEFTRICKEKKAKYFAAMVTNGYLLNREHIDFLIKNMVSSIQITIDGPKIIHDKRRILKNGKGTFDRIMGNLERLTKDDPIRVGIRVNIDKRNSAHMRELFEEFIRRGFHQRDNISFNLAQVLELTNCCQDVTDQCMFSKEFAEYITDEYRMAIDMGFKLKHYPVMNSGSCGAVSQNVFLIEPGGNVHACWSTAGNDDLKIGVLTEKGISLNENYYKWQGWHPYVTEHCESCNVLPLCMGGCAYKSLYKNHIANADQILCSWWKYNLEPMLLLAKDANEKGLLPIAKQHPCSTEPDAIGDQREQSGTDQKQVA